MICSKNCSSCPTYSTVLYKLSCLATETQYKIVLIVIMLTSQWKYTITHSFSTSLKICSCIALQWHLPSHLSSSTLGKSPYSYVKSTHTYYNVANILFAVVQKNISVAQFYTFSASYYNMDLLAVYRRKKIRIKNTFPETERETAKQKG